MIVFVDYEHADQRTAPWGERLLAARTRITYRLEDLSGRHCMLVRYDRITPALLGRLGAEALFISGNSVDPDRYDAASLGPLAAIVAEARLPTFGFCGGFQFLAQALGAQVVPLRVDPGSAAGAGLHDSADGVAREVGYGPVDLVADHPLLAGLDPAPVVRHAHSLEVPEPPAGFATLASTPITPVQMVVDDQRRIVGTQFHPEYYTDEHPAGRRMIENFLRWAGVTQA